MTDRTRYLVDGMEVYPFWDLTSTAIPARSRLYHLEPIGVGTPYVESLTSYIARLAEAHGVYATTLIHNELGSLYGRGRVFSPRSLPSLISRNIGVLNATCAQTRHWVQILETLTLRNDLRFLTLLPWADVLTPVGLLRPTRAWCPACYEEWRDTGHTLYEPLLWALAPVTACPQHRRRLRLRCPHDGCQRPLPPLTMRGRLGHCSYCGGWLGAGEKSERLDKASLVDVGLKEEVWAGEVIGSLLGVGPFLPAPPQKAKLVRAICMLRDHVGNAVELARILRLCPNMVRCWCRGDSLPRLEMLLHVCRTVGVSLFALLMYKHVFAKPPRIDSVKAILRKAPRPSPGNQTRWALELALRSHEPRPPPMREVARRLDYSVNTLGKWFPELCRAISTRHNTFRKSQARQKIQKLREEVRRVTFSLHAEGVYPSQARVNRMLPIKGGMWYADLRGARHQALHDLGYQK